MANQKHNYGIVLIEPPAGLGIRMREHAMSSIHDGDLYGKDEGLGYEDKPHITVKYGLIPPIHIEKIRKLFKRFKPVLLEMGHVTKFEAVEDGQADAVIVHIRAPKQLEQIVRVLSDEVECKPSDYKEYIPHATLAYVRRGACEHCIGSREFVGESFWVRQMRVKGPEGSSNTIPLG
jgi:2'-5' RNA ligase